MARAGGPVASEARARAVEAVRARGMATLARVATVMAEEGAATEGWKVVAASVAAEEVRVGAGRGAGVMARAAKVAGAARAAAEKAVARVLAAATGRA